LNQLKEVNQVLQRELQQSIATAEFFRKSTYQHAQTINEIMKLAEGLKNKPGTCDRDGEEGSYENPQLYSQQIGVI
jgi:hypothetical protein